MSYSPKNKRYNYTTGGEYTLSGTDYIGYFNVENKIARTGRSISSRSQLLTPTNKIAVDMYQYEIGNELIFPDRLILDAISLPNSLEEIIIPPNEIITNRVFTAHLKRLYENTLFLYSQLKIASNDIPNGYSYWIGVSSNEQKWNPSSIITTNFPYENFDYPDIDSSKKCITIKTDNNQDYISFIVSSTIFSIISSKADKTKTAAVFKTNTIDLNSNKIYSNIEDISVAGKFLYLLDGGDNTIYKYDIAGYITTDNTIKDRKFLVDTIGHLGDAKDRSAFNQPSVIEATADRLYVYDRGNQCIKVYTGDLTWVNTFILSPNDNVVDIKYNEYHDAVFALVERLNTDYIVFVFDKDIKNKLKEYDLDEKYEEIIDGEVKKISTNRRNRIVYALDPRERLRGIRFSSQDSNIFYIFSNYNIYKKFLTKPQFTIGKWSITKAAISWGYIWNFIDINFNDLFVTWQTISAAGRENIDIIDMSILPREDNFDDIFVPMKAGSPEAFKMLYCNEYTLYDTVLINSDISAYNTKRFGTLENEYINAFTINKEIYKQIFNVLALKNLIKGRFAGSYNIAGNLVYEQYDYITDAEIESVSISNIENFYVHENEHVSSEVLNRSLRKLYDIQHRILNLVKARIKNITPTIALTGLNILRIE